MSTELAAVRMGLPGAADDLARIVYAKVKSLHLSLPSLADERLRGRSWASLAEADQAMIDLDGTAKKSRLGANAAMGTDTSGWR
jgi:hypothetical protein